MGPNPGFAVRSTHARRTAASSSPMFPVMSSHTFTHSCASPPTYAITHTHTHTHTHTAVDGTHSRPGAEAPLRGLGQLRGNCLPVRPSQTGSTARFLFSVAKTRGEGHHDQG